MRYLMIFLFTITLLGGNLPEKGNTIDGKSYQLSKDKATVVVFFASWCGSCKKEIPTLLKLHKELNNRIDMVGVNVDEALQSGLDMVKKYQLPYPVLHDPALKLGKRLNVKATPTIILYNREQKEVVRAHSINKEIIKGIRGELLKLKQLKKK